MVAIDKAVEQPQVFRAGFDDADRQRPQVPQIAADRPRGVIHKWDLAIAAPVLRGPTPLGQVDQTGPFQLQQQRAGCHILDATPGVPPVPPPAQLLAQPSPRPVRMLRKQASNQTNIFREQLSSLDDHDLCHSHDGRTKRVLSPAENLTDAATYSPISPVSPLTRPE